MKTLTALVIVVLLTGVAAAQETLCGLQLNQAPPIRGFRLGMTEAELRKRFPDLRIPKATKYGETVINLHFTPANFQRFGSTIFNEETSSMVSTQSFPEFLGLKDAGFNLVDGSIFSMTFIYDSGTKWRNIDQFADALSSSLKLPTTWAEDEEREGIRHLRCRGFWVKADLQSNSAGVLVLTDTAAVALLQSRRADKTEAGRKVFKP